MNTAFRRTRMTWMLVPARAAPLYALPSMFQAIYEAAGWPPRLGVGQVPPGAVLEGTWWLRQVAPCLPFLVLAAVVPGRLHARWLSRLKMPVVEGALGPALSYRHPVERQWLLGARGARALAAAYDARISAVLLVLMPSLVIGYCIARPVPSWGLSPRITFSSPAEYLPAFIAATVIVLLNAPTKALLLGPHAHLRARRVRGT
jgi:hypothetical protein